MKTEVIKTRLSMHLLVRKVIQNYPLIKKSKQNMIMSFHSRWMRQWPGHQCHVKTGCANYRWGWH